MKLFERFRWLATDSVTPGTADVSGKSCVLATLVGDTPGTSSASSRKFRPFIGRLRTSASETVAAIWLRAASSTVASAVTVTFVAIPLTLRVTGSSNARADRHGQVTHGVLKPGLPHRDFVRADTKVREPKASVLIGGRGRRQVCLRLTGSNLRVRHDGARLVRDPPADTADIDRLLREC